MYVVIIQYVDEDKTNPHRQMIIAGREDRQALADIIQILRNTQNPQVANKHQTPTITPADSCVMMLAFVMVMIAHH